MHTFSITSNKIMFQIKIKDNEKKYLVTAQSPIDVEQDVKLKGVNLKAFLKLMKIKSMRITDEVATTLEDYLLNVKPKDAKSGCITFYEEDRNKYITVRTENGEEKYFAIRKLYDDVKKFNSSLTNN